MDSIFAIPAIRLFSSMPLSAALPTAIKTNGRSVSQVDAVKTLFMNNDNTWFIDEG
jgi:hypothetical protein